MIAKNSRLHCYVFILALSLIVAACGPSTARRIKEGNQAFQDEAYLVALQAYQDAQDQSPDLAEPHYNGANALYREQAFADALSELTRALELVEQVDLEEHGFFNLGNTSYNMEDWESAVAAYTEALLLDTEDQDAKYNLELAQWNQEQKEEQDESDEGSSGENQNQDEGDDSEENNDTSQQDSSGSENEPSSGNGADQNTEQSKNSDQQDEVEQNDGNEGEEAENGSPNQPNGSQQEGDENGQNGSYIIKPGERMSEEQARQLLATIAENSETLMEKLEQIFVVPFGAPLQDW